MSPRGVERGRRSGGPRPQERAPADRVGPEGNGSAAIGARLRLARQRRGLSVAELAEATGLTKGFISQVERSLSNASVESLVKICNALGVGVGVLFEPATTALIRADERPRVHFGGEGVREWLLTPDGERRIQVLEGTIEPGGGSGREPYALPSDSCWVYVIAGRLTVVVNERRYELGVGDALTFSPDLPHLWRNPSGEEAARVLWVLAPPVEGLDEEEWFAGVP